ncbi:MAG: aldehyde dehydrogenase family protein [Myxococcaceae bacterium]|nr:MAG: aldehyde dehydrogenase family protein [Myxococcaceae bacterium]
MVLDDATFAKAAKNAVLSALETTGRRCPCGLRLIVTRGTADRFVEEVTHRAAALVIGHPLD